MGCGISQVNQHKNFVLRPSHPRDYQIQGKLLPILNITNPLNINSKYIHIMEIDIKNQTGISIYKTNEYKCKISQEELQKKKTEFWGKIKRNKN